MTSHHQEDDILIRFVTRFSGLLEKHLVSVRELMASTVQTVMEQAIKMEQTSASTRKTAEERFAASGGQVNEDATTLVQGMQKVVTGLFEDAREAAQQNSPTALKALDDKLSELAVNAMGALSSEDVMVQRIEHIILAARGLETTLSYLLIDFNKRNTPDRVSGFAEDLLDFTYRQYTSEDEKKEFLQVFPEWKDAG